MIFNIILKSSGFTYKTIPSQLIKSSNFTKRLLLKKKKKAQSSLVLLKCMCCSPAVQPTSPSRPSSPKQDFVFSFTLFIMTAQPGMQYFLSQTE